MLSGAEVNFVKAATAPLDVQGGGRQRRRRITFCPVAFPSSSPISRVNKMILQIRDGAVKLHVPIFDINLSANNGEKE